MAFLETSDLLSKEQHGFRSGRLDWIVQCLTSPPTQYRLYGRRFLQVKRPNQQYQSTEGRVVADRVSLIF